MSDLPSINDMLQAARVDFLARAAYAGEYSRRYGINLDALRACIGAWGLAKIVDCGNHRFDFDEHGIEAFVLEAYGPDGETVVDLVAWPVSSRTAIMTMFGRVGLLGAWEAAAPGTYFMGGTLALHRTPLEWMEAGCKGAVIIVPHIAARQLAEAPGPIAGRDKAHGREVIALLKSTIDPDKKVVVPFRPERTAA